METIKLSLVVSFAIAIYYCLRFLQQVQPLLNLMMGVEGGWTGAQQQGAGQLDRDYAARQDATQRSRDASTASRSGSSSAGSSSYRPSGGGASRGGASRGGGGRRR